jgi:hypothetical protein
VINTAHVANGALVLGASLVLTLRSHRALFAETPLEAARLRQGFGEAAAGARS